MEASEYVENLIHAAGIQSHGLTSSPSIARDICEMFVEKLKQEITLKLKKHFIKAGKIRSGLNRLPFEERAKIIKKNPLYGRIACRCEKVTEGEIRDSLQTRIPVASLDGIKRRTRAGMGRCQGGFCSHLCHGNNIGSIRA